MYPKEKPKYEETGKGERQEENKALTKHINLPGTGQNTSVC